MFGSWLIITLDNLRIVINCARGESMDCVYSYPVAQYVDLYKYILGQCVVFVAQDNVWNVFMGVWYANI